MATERREWKFTLDQVRDELKRSTARMRQPDRIRTLSPQDVALFCKLALANPGKRVRVYSSQGFTKQRWSSFYRRPIDHSIQFIEQGKCGGIYSGWAGAWKQNPKKAPLITVAGRRYPDPRFPEADST